MAVITISRQYGTGGIFIAHKLADKLGYAFLGRDELVEICEQRGLTLDLEKIEGRAPTILERTFGVGRDSLRSVLSECMNEAADKGNVVIGGWGGQVLLKDRTDALHVRIVGSLEARIRHFMESSGVTRTAAEETIKRSDRDQGLFSQYFFNVDFADSTLYHSTLNIEQTSPESMISFIETMIAEKENTAT